MTEIEPNSAGFVDEIDGLIAQSAVTDITRDEAQRLTEQIRSCRNETYRLLIEAYEKQAWRALGYTSWGDYIAAEFDADNLRLPQQARPEVVAAMREAGLSLRAIGAAVSVDETTVRRDLDQVRQHAAAPRSDNEPTTASEPQPDLPRPITGLDGKHYAPTKSKPKPEPVTPQFSEGDWNRAMRTLRKAVDAAVEISQRTPPTGFIISVSSQPVREMLDQLRQLVDFGDSVIAGPNDNEVTQ
jgi:hypothetical protein